MPLKRVRQEFQRLEQQELQPQERLGFLRQEQQLPNQLLLQEQKLELRPMVQVQGWCWQLARNP